MIKHRNKYHLLNEVLLFLFGMTMPFSLFGQSSTTIDSLNQLPFEQKIQNANRLLPRYLNNWKQIQSPKYNKRANETAANISLLLYYQGKYDLQIEWGLKAIRGFQYHQDWENVAQLYGEMGYRMKRHNMILAEGYMQRGLHLAEHKNLDQPLMGLYDNYGVLKEMQEQWDSAYFFYQKGLKLKMRYHDQSGLPYSLNNLGGLFLLQKKYAQARPFFEKALQVRQSLNDSIGLCETNLSLASLDQAEKKPIKALQRLDFVVHYAQRKGLTDLLVQGLQQRASLWNSLGKSDKAVSDYQEVVRWKDSLNLSTMRAKQTELEVSYRTQEKEQQLHEQELQVARQKYWLGFLVLGLLSVLGIGWLLLRQQKLKLLQTQQAFALEKAIQEVANQNQLHEQRLAISRDLHDNIGAQLTFIISSIDTLKFAFPALNEKLTLQLDRISEFSQQTIRELRDTIWAMNHGEFHMEDLKMRLSNFIEKAASVATSVQFDFQCTPEASAVTFSSLSGIHLYRSIQEAVNNALKYAQPNRIQVQVQRINNSLQIEIRDDGKGFDLENVNFGNGLHNMRKRMEEIGGNLEIKTLTNHGTQILLQLPV